METGDTYSVYELLYVLLLYLDLGNLVEVFFLLKTYIIV